MSKIVAIITEYNPFHNGHKYQIDKIKAENSDAIIIAIMSGNIVQRGEFAFLDKYARAEMALSCGVDAVFELPYPYSGSTAEIFAYGGVRLAYNLGADILYFGTESDNLSELEAIAQVIDTEAFENAVNSIPNASELSFPVLREKALSNLGYDVTKSSNDMLAIEYIRQIKKNKSFTNKVVKFINSTAKKFKNASPKAKIIGTALAIAAPIVLHLNNKHKINTGKNIQLHNDRAAVEARTKL